MDVIIAIEKLQKVTGSLQSLSFDQKRRIQDKLKFFLTQARSPRERRAAEYDLRACWNLLSREIAGTPLKEHRAALMSLMGFLGIPLEKTTPERYGDWSAETFFMNAAEWVQRTRPRGEHDSKLLYFSLTTLRDQCKRGAQDRDHAIIAKSWRSVLELSKNTTLFARFHGETRLRTTLAEFLRPSLAMSPPTPNVPSPTREPERAAR